MFSFKLILANCCLFQKSKQHSDKETESSQNNGFAKMTLAEQKVTSSFVVQDAVRNVTIKPETTKRQDEVTGRLPNYTRYTSPRMMKAQAHMQDSTMSRRKNEPPKVHNIYKCMKIRLIMANVIVTDEMTVRQTVNLSVNLSVCPSQLVSPLVGQFSSQSVSLSVSQSVSLSVC